MPFRKALHKEMDVLSMDKSYADRYVNDGFSGGERKRMKSCKCACWNRN